MTSMESGSIGIFDSGVGGLSVALEIRKALPSEDIIYFGDQANVPYGTKSLEVIQQLSAEIAAFLMKKNAKIIVIACNTASAASLRFLRNKYPDFPFVGMEPAIKPASQATKTGRIGVLATPATFKGELYQRTLERFADGKQVCQDTCPGLVEQIEAGQLNSQKTINILRNSLAPMIDVGVDSIVLGCTHYPFVIEQIREIVGPNVNIINPAPAVARQAYTVLKERGALKPDSVIGNAHYITTGNLQTFEDFILQVASKKNSTIESVSWSNLQIAETL